VRCSAALAQRDPGLSDHVGDVADLAEHTARAMGCSSALAERVRMAVELHDIGKMAIPEAILAKTGPLTDQEWALMHQHTVAGERIIAASPALADVGPLVRSSHERWDGSGYGRGGDAVRARRGRGVPAGAR
jgi:two-component system cell cycle response regulator